MGAYLQPDRHCVSVVYLEGRPASAVIQGLDLVISVKVHDRLKILNWEADVVRDVVLALNVMYLLGRRPVNLYFMMSEFILQELVG